jgi:hypothetical protein
MSVAVGSRTIASLKARIFAVSRAETGLWPVTRLPSSRPGGRKVIPPPESATAARSRFSSI